MTTKPDEYVSWANETCSFDHKVTPAFDRYRWQQLPRPIVFTNGCFDILHRGHITYLDQARRCGNSLIVAVNSDASVKMLDKGTDRPINPLADRMACLAALSATDWLIPFDEATPLALIQQIRPDVLIKGGDWPIDAIVGNDFVRSYGGEVRAIPFRYQRSTTALLASIRGTSHS